VLHHPEAKYFNTWVSWTVRRSVRPTGPPSWSSAGEFRDLPFNRPSAGRDQQCPV